MRYSHKKVMRYSLNSLQSNVLLFKLVTKVMHYSLLTAVEETDKTLAS